MRAWRGGERRSIISAKCDQIERILIHIISSGFYMFCEIFSILYSQYNPRNGIQSKDFLCFSPIIFKKTERTDRDADAGINLMET